MRLVARLKDVFQVGVSNAKFLIPLAMAISTPAFALTSPRGCGSDAVSSLPDLPVAIQRVERSEDGRVRVSWHLRTSLEDGEDVGTPRQLQTGAEFDVLRCLPPGRWVAVGQGEVLARNGGLVEGLLNAAGSAPSVDRGVKDELVSAGNLYPMPMVGDLVVVRRKEIAQVRTISPRVTIAANHLFESSSDQGLQVELTRSGRDSLKQLLSRNFSDAHGKLLIEVHSQRAGSRQKLRQETAQRAESIERFLRYEFGIAKEQLVAVGHGSDSYVPGFVPYGADADFVVLRMLNGTSASH